jgi:hypothetical protein
MDEPVDKYKSQLAQKFHAPALEISEQPVVRGTLSEGTFTLDDFQGSWEYYGCLEDHLVDCSGKYSPAQYIKSWAYTQLESQTGMDLGLRLTTPGPADIWVNQKHVGRKDTFHNSWPEPELFQIHFASGLNEIHVRFENVVLGDSAHFFAFQLYSTNGQPLSNHSDSQNGDNVTIKLPTTIMPRLLGLRSRLEMLFAEIALERDVFERDHQIAISLPDAPHAEEIITIRVQDMNHIIFRDGAIEAKRAQRIPLNYAFELIGGSYLIELLPRIHEYYELNLRIKKDILFWTVGNAPYSTSPYGTYPDRRRDGLLKAAEQKGNLYAEIAKMASNWWHQVNAKRILTVIDRINESPEGFLLEMAGLCGMLYRFADHPKFPTGIRQPLESCLLSYPFAPGKNRQGAEAILTSTCELLIGQHFPTQVFAHSGKTGRQQMQHAAKRALVWMLERGQGGFDDWGSSEEITQTLIALSLLVDLAEDAALQELAVVMLDKIFFAMALNSFQGILSNPQRQVTSLDVKGGLLQPTVGIARLMWGQGVFNHRIEGFVSLGCMEQYELPKLIAEIAVRVPAEMWAKEQHASKVPVNKVTYRTPDYHLSSAQDFLPGTAGISEHIWQATLGPGAIVFVTNPGSASDKPGIKPSFWVGNASLPKVVQWKNTLIAIYNLPKENWMGFTHAYFPTKSFDEYCVRDNWGFARKGNGYLAITSSQGIHLIEQGPQSFKEIRSPGSQNIWVCHMGRETLDGNFCSFQQKILELPIQFNGLTAKLSGLNSDEISIDFNGSFLVNGEEVSLSGYPHFENPYASTAMHSEQIDIVVGDAVLRLDFSTPHKD